MFTLEVGQAVLSSGSLDSHKLLAERSRWDGFPRHVAFGCLPLEWQYEAQ